MPRPLVRTAGFLWISVVALVGCSQPAGPAIGGGSGGGGGGGGTRLPADPVARVELGGLEAAVAGAGTVRLDWTAPASGFECALFQASTRSAVYSGSPYQEKLGGTSLIVSGLADGVETWFGLGTRKVGDATYTQVGLPLCVRPSRPIYVDAAASGAGADGETPATAFTDLRPALVKALAVEGANVWVREGTYSAAPYAISAGVAIHGGFKSDFTLENRVAKESATVFVSAPNQNVFVITNAATVVTLDGVTCDGRSASGTDVEVNSSSAEFRSTRLLRSGVRGLRVRNVQPVPHDLTLVACDVSDNGADGMYAQGPLRVFLARSRFLTNVQEGVELDDLVALDGDLATMEMRDCRVAGNGSEGVDIDLGLPPTSGSTGGVYDVSIQGCTFEDNALDGFLIDEDFELAPAWSAKIRIAECGARRNGRSGFHLDLDARGDSVLHRVCAAGNQGAGVEVTSESAPGAVTIAASALLGNLGAGIRVWQGNKSVHASHCVFAGNFGGGVLSESVGASVTSSIFHLQTTPLTKATATASPEIGEPLPEVFENAAQGYTKVTAIDGGRLTVEGTAPAVGTKVEVGDDGVLRTVVSIAGQDVIVDPAPTARVAPTVLANFAALATTVVENLRLRPLVPGQATALVAPGTTLRDCGPFGPELGGDPGYPTTPAREFAWVSAMPAAADSVVDARAALAFRLTKSIDTSPSSLANLRVVDEAGSALAVQIAVTADQVRIEPPVSGFPARFFVHFCPEVRCITTGAFGAPVAVPFRTQ